MQTAIITGAGSGIGKAAAKRFSAAGWGVMLADSNPESVTSVASEIQRDRGTCLSVTADVTRSSDLEHAVELSRREWGRVDVLVANAGIQTAGSLAETGPDDWQKVIDVNLTGAALSCQSVLPVMRQQKSGSIVIVSSVNALVGSKNMAAYDMSKAGLFGLMRNIAVEFGREGIRANAICPGNTITDVHIEKLAREGLDIDDIRAAMSDYGALGRAAEPEEIAKAILFLASDDASFVTGHVLVADGGFSMMPGN